jgi:hypothetical protein
MTEPAEKADVEDEESKILIVTEVVRKSASSINMMFASSHKPKY